MIGRFDDDLPAPKWPFRGAVSLCKTNRMIRLFRLFSLMSLCLALALGSVSMAVARGQAVALSKGGTTIVICSGYGVTSITLDDQGNPIGPIHPCPECLAGLAAYLPPAVLGLIAVAPAGERLVAGAPVSQLRTAAVLTTRARGPPLIV